MHPEIKLSISDSVPFMDEVTCALLKAIDELHSVIDASKSIGISYSTAWNRIHSLEERLGCSAVARQRGGCPKAGKSVLTERGKAIAAAYESFHTAMEKAAEKSFDTYFGDLAGHKLFVICTGRTQAEDSEAVRNLEQLPLSEIGKVQSCLLWRELSGENIRRVYADETIAALQSADIIFGAEAPVTPDKITCSFTKAPPDSNTLSGAGFSVLSAERHSGLLFSSLSEECLSGLANLLMAEGEGSAAIITDEAGAVKLLSAAGVNPGATAHIKPGAYFVLEGSGNSSADSAMLNPAPVFTKLLCSKLLHTFHINRSAYDRAMKKMDSSMADAELAEEVPPGCSERIFFECLSDVPGMQNVISYLKNY